MEFKRNPFQFGGALSPKDLVGRKDEIALVENAIRSCSRLFLAGPRRFGKTSILRAAQENLRRHGADVLYVNTESCADMEKLVAEIVAAAANRLRNRNEDGVSEAARFFSSLKPEFRFEGNGKELSVNIAVKVSPDPNSQIELFAETLDSLNRLAGARRDSRLVGLIIDEFSTLIAREGELGEAKIRSVIQQHQNFAYVFVGSDVRLMTDMISKHDRPFYRGGDSCFVGPVLTEGFVAWLHKQFRRGGFVVCGDEPINLILSLAEEVPHNVQMLAHNCWEELSSQGRSKPAKLTVPVVESVFERVVNGLIPYFTQTWIRLTPAQQKALIAYLHANGEQMSSTKTARSVNLPVASLQSAFRALHDQNILWQDFAAGRSRTRFADPFFAHWIKMFTA
jgi:hypothetical protein